MGKKQTEDKIVKEFVKKVGQKFDAEKIVWFGSRVKGEALKTSDYDFLVVSKCFKGIFFPKRTSMVYRELLDLPASFDILCYTPEEFERKKKELCIVREAVKEGKTVFNV